MMKKLPLALSICSVLTVNSVLAQDKMANDYWLPLSSDELATRPAVNSLASHKKTFSLDIARLDRAVTNDEESMVRLPLPTGQFVTFKLQPSEIMAPELASKYPSIKTFTGVQIDNPNHIGRFDLTPHGFHAVFNYQNDKVFIDPITRDNSNDYQAYYKRDAKPVTELSKRLAPRVKDQTERFQARGAKLSNSEAITYRIAIAATAEYSEFHGGTKEKSLAALVTMLNRVNEVYQRDLAITLQLVGNNDAIIYTDADSDPFKNTDEDIDLASNVINDAIGDSEYDIGHVVGTGGGGLAGLGVVCTEYKAEGITGSDSPTNDAFHIDYVAHEIGHQFGAEHTFNGESEACDGNRVATSAYEPGSASSIMGYAGICGEQNLQDNSDPYFHIHSIDQIKAFVQQGEGKRCGTRTTKVNQAPEVNAGKDYTIPARTPFVLTGEASDAEQDRLTYSWQQFDLGGASASMSEDRQDDGQRPLFRSFEPGNEPVRTLPRMADVLSGSASYGETLPTASRDLNFRLVVRDNNGNLADDAMKVTVVATEQGFNITAPDTGTVWQTGTQVVTWNTADTEQAPVSCSQVNIDMSLDSGLSFSRRILEKAPNTGSAEVELTDIQSGQVRFKIGCSDNIFFTVNTGDVTVADQPVATKPIFKGQKSLSVAEDSSLTLSLSDLEFDKGVDGIQLTAGENFSVNGLTITPTPDFFGRLTVIATATRDELTSDTFSIDITVESVNDAPMAQDDTASVQQDSASNSITVVENDTDIDGDALSLSSFDYSGAGTLAISGNKLFYTPASGFSGTEHIGYTVTDNQGATASAQLTITVNASVKPEEPKESSGGSHSGYLLISLLALKLLRRVRMNHA